MAVYDPNDDAFDPSTYGSLQQSYLPKTRKHSAGGSLSQKSADAAFQRYIELSGGKDDYTQAQEQALTRSEQANMDDRLAIAAQYAGPKFAGMQESYLKKAMAEREPTRVGSAMIGPDGTVVRDPSAERARQEDMQFRLGQHYSQKAEREERQADRNDQISSRQAELAYQHQRDFAADANAAAKSRRESGLGFGATKSGGFTDKNEAVYLSRNSTPFITVNGVPTEYMGEIKYPSAIKDPTEDQGKTAGLFIQADNARKNMMRAIDIDPQASIMPVKERAKLMLPIIGEDYANVGRTAARQMFTQAAGSMTEALLRAASGAGITKQETDQKVRELVPQIGDKADTIKQKTDSYAVYMASLRKRAGRALDEDNAIEDEQIIDLPPPERP